MHSGSRRSIWLIPGLVVLLSFAATAEVVTYELDNVILDDNSAQMFGTFTWTYDVGDFENGAGQFITLDIPFTSHDQTDLDTAFDIGNSIEITLPGSVHDDGVDITLFLTQPLTPTTGTTIDLERSRFEIGGNGFHTGSFLSGNIVLAGATDVADAPAAALTAYPNPFNPSTTVAYDLPQSVDVRIVVHDVAGRAVRTLVAEAHHAAGRYEVSWRGRDDSGRTVATGVYFVRLQAGDQALLRKVVLLK